MAQAPAKRALSSENETFPDGSYLLATTLDFGDWNNEAGGQLLLTIRGGISAFT